MPQFPSSEWIDAFCDQLATHPRAADAARHLGGVYRFVIDPAGPLRARHQYHVSLTVDGDDARVERIAQAARVRVGVQADYPHWQKLLRGQLDLGRAMLFGRIRISGDLGALLGARGDVDVVVDALRTVDTQWLEGVS